MKLINAGHLIKWLKDTYCNVNKQTWSYDHHVMASEMIEILNNYRNAYYNKDEMPVSDEQYDNLIKDDADNGKMF